MATLSDDFRQTSSKTITENDIVLLDFWASWCGPLPPVSAQVFEGGVGTRTPTSSSHKIDTEDQQQLAANFRHHVRFPTPRRVPRERHGLLPARRPCRPKSLENLIEQGPRARHGRKSTRPVAEQTRRSRSRPITITRVTTTTHSESRSRPHDRGATGHACDNRLLDIAW